MKIRQCYFNITLPSRYTYLYSRLDKIRMKSKVVTQDLQLVLHDTKVLMNSENRSYQRPITESTDNAPAPRTMSIIERMR
jgi:hypothetical protein